MKSVHTRRSLRWGLLVLLGFCSSPAVLQSMRTAAANGPPTVTTADPGQKVCFGKDATLAHERADLAFRKAQYQLAGQCYLIAGDKPRADLAFIKAAAAGGPTTKRQLAANASQVKAQFRQLREAFSSH